MRDEAADDIAFQDLARHAGAETFPGLLILRFDAPLFFANANVFRDAVRASVEEHESPSVVLIDAESISDIDSTALLMIADLQTELAERGIDLWFARVKSRVGDLADRVKELRPVEIGSRFPTIRSAVDAFEAR